MPLFQQQQTNEVICHGIPDGRPLEDGDIVNVDVTVYFDGVHGDLNETFLVGNVDEESLKLVRTTYECLDKCIQVCKPGERYRDMGDIITKHAHKNKLSVVRTYCGHGIHTEFHTAPSVPHYSKNKANGVMKPGHCFTIEPMINQGTWGYWVFHSNSNVFYSFIWGVPTISEQMFRFPGRHPVTCLSSFVATMYSLSPTKSSLSSLSFCFID